MGKMWYLVFAGFAKKMPQLVSYLVVFFNFKNILKILGFGQNRKKRYPSVVLRRVCCPFMVTPNNGRFLPKQEHSQSKQ